MIIVIVKFKISSSTERNLIKTKFLETAPMYRETIGLLRKNYLIDNKNHTAGGVYCFDKLENAKNWFDKERIEYLTKRYSKPTIEYFENPIIVDNEKGKILS